VAAVANAKSRRKKDACLSVFERTECPVFMIALPSDVVDVTPRIFR
jgi:hypothetical protein